MIARRLMCEKGKGNMRKREKKLFAILFSCLFVFMAMTMTGHAEGTNVEVRLETEKEVYTHQELAKTEVIVSNYTNLDIYDVDIQLDIPEGLSLADDSSSQLQLDEIPLGETRTHTVYLKENPSEALLENEGDQPIDTGSAKQIALWGAGAFLAGCAALLFYKRKKGIGRKISLFLLAVMLASMNFSFTGIRAKASTESIIADTTLQFDDNTYPLKATVTYTLSSGIPAENAVTREQWITSLMQELNLNADLHIDKYSFIDISQTEDSNSIEMAYRYGILPIETKDEGNLRFSPEAPVTREFAAYSIVHGMRYQVEQSDINWTDVGECQYPAEDALAVELGLLDLRNNEFLPNELVSQEEADEMLSKVNDLMSVGGNNEDEIVYAEGVEETLLDYSLDEEKQQITIRDTQIIEKWSSGEIHALLNKTNEEDSIAIRIEKIDKTDTTAVITYSQPELQEVVSSFNVSGSQKTEGVFVPAEGITILGPSAKARSAVSGEISLFDPFEFSAKAKIKDADGKEQNVEILKGTLGIDSLDYKFQIDFNWGIPSVDRVYLALNNSVQLSSDVELGDLIDDDILSQKIELGSFEAPLGYGFFAKGTLYAVYQIDGSFTLDYELSNVAGIDYNKGKFKTIFDVRSQLNELTLQGEFQAGFMIEPSVTFLKLDIVHLGVEFGRSFEGSLDVVQPVPLLFCLDGQTYIYAKISGGVLGSLWSFEQDILTEKNGVDRYQKHFEEIGEVPQCTRDMGSYTGTVMDKKKGLPIKDAVITLLEGEREIDQVKTDERGAFASDKIKSGTYTIRIEADGYHMQEQTIDIKKGENADLGEIFLDSTADVKKISGTVYDSETMTPLSDVELMTEDERYSAVTDAYGQFSMNIPKEASVLIAKKDGYTTKTVAIEPNDSSQTVSIYLEKDMESIKTLTIREGETYRLTKISGDKSDTVHYIMKPLEDTVYDIAHYGGGFYSLGLDIFYSGSALNDMTLGTDDSPYKDYLNQYNDITVTSGELLIYAVDEQGNMIDIGETIVVEKRTDPAIAEYHVKPRQTLKVDGSFLPEVIYDGSLYWAETVPGTVGEIKSDWTDPELEPLVETIEYPWSASVESGNDIKYYSCTTGEIVLYFARDDIGRIISVSYDD